VLAAVGGTGDVMDAASGGGAAVAVAAGGAAVVSELAHAATPRAPAASRTPANGLTNNSDDGRERDGNI
jgi:hypothetical protein